MENTEVGDLFMSPYEDAVLLIVRLAIIVIACVVASGLIWACAHKRDYADAKAWRSALVRNAIAMVVLVVVSTVWGALASGSFLSILYAGLIGEYVLCILPDLFSNVMYALASGLVLCIVRVVVDFFG